MLIVEPIVSVKVTDAVCAGAPESVTLNVSDGAPAKTGVPLITPEGLSPKPTGSVPPVNCHVSVPVPPFAFSWAE